MNDCNVDKQCRWLEFNDVWHSIDTPPLYRCKKYFQPLKKFNHKIILQCKDCRGKEIENE